MSSDEVISANVRHQTRKCILTIFITQLNYAKIMQKFTAANSATVSVIKVP